MHILDKIVAHKRKEVEQQKTLVSAMKLEQDSHFNLTVPSAAGYQEAGAAGMSVLTDSHFFGGSVADFQNAKSSITLPLLRKDFIIDEYQIVEAKSMGAAVILLIARILTKQEMKTYTQVAHDLGMEVLVEIHNQEELDNCPIEMDLIGVNNRNLDTFEVDYENSIRLKNQLPQSLCKISESGIHSIDTMLMLRKEGFDGFLIGEKFMKEANPGEACKTFLSDYRTKLAAVS